MTLRDQIRLVQFVIKQVNRDDASGRFTITFGAGDRLEPLNAFYDQHPGHWETPHGCDPFWSDGDFFLSELKVSKVGENGIRPNFIYQLDKQGNFCEVGPASNRNTSPSI